MTRARNLADFNTTNIDPSSLDDTGTIPSALLAGVGETNTPAFSVQGLSSISQTVQSGYWQPVTFQVELKDTDSAFDTTQSKFTVPSGKAGLYSFQYSTQNAQKAASNRYYQIALYKNGALQNGTIVRQNPTTTGTYDVYLNGSASLDLAVGDFVQVYFSQNTGGNVTIEDDNKKFSGFRVT